MRKSVKRLYEIDRRYDYAPDGSHKKRKFVKKRATKRLRQQLKKNLDNYDKV